MLCHVLEENGDCWLASVVYLLYMHSYVFLFVMPLRSRLVRASLNLVNFSSYGIQMAIWFCTTGFFVTILLSFSLKFARYNLGQANQFLAVIQVRYVDALIVCKSLHIFNWNLQRLKNWLCQVDVLYLVVVGMYTLACRIQNILLWLLK